MFQRVSRSAQIDQTRGRFLKSEVWIQKAEGATLRACPSKPSSTKTARWIYFLSPRTGSHWEFPGQNARGQCWAREQVTLANCAETLTINTSFTTFPYRVCCQSDWSYCIDFNYLQAHRCKISSLALPWRDFTSLLCEGSLGTWQWGIGSLGISQWHKTGSIRAGQWQQKAGQLSQVIRLKRYDTLCNVFPILDWILRGEKSYKRHSWNHWRTLKWFIEWSLFFLI